MVEVLCNRRYTERSVGYVESHDQALVGDQALGDCSSIISRVTKVCARLAWIVSRMPSFPHVLTRIPPSCHWQHLAGSCRQARSRSPDFVVQTLMCDWAINFWPLESAAKPPPIVQRTSPVQSPMCDQALQSRVIKRQCKQSLRSFQMQHSPASRLPMPRCCGAQRGG